MGFNKIVDRREIQRYLKGAMWSDAKVGLANTVIKFIISTDNLRGTDAGRGRCGARPQAACGWGQTAFFTSNFISLA